MSSKVTFDFDGVLRFGTGLLGSEPVSHCHVSSNRPCIYFSAIVAGLVYVGSAGLIMEFFLTTIANVNVVVDKADSTYP